MPSSWTRETSSLNSLHKLRLLTGTDVVSTTFAVDDPDASSSFTFYGATTGFTGGQFTVTVTKLSSIIITVISCKERKGHKTTVPATWRPTTETFRDVTTVYTTASTSTAPTVTVVYTTVITTSALAVKGLTVSSQSSLITVTSDTICPATQAIFISFNGAVKVGISLIAMVAIPFAT